MTKSEAELGRKNPHRHEEYYELVVIPFIENNNLFYIVKLVDRTP